MLKIKFIDGFLSKDTNSLFWYVFHDPDGWWTGSHWYNPSLQSHKIKIRHNRKVAIFAVSPSESLIIVAKQHNFFLTSLIFIHEFLHFITRKLPINKYDDIWKKTICKFIQWWRK